MPFDEVLGLLPSDLTQNADDPRDPLMYQTILVIANVTELATGKTLSGNSTVRCQSKQYQLEFLEMTPDSYKRGLDFTGYVSSSYAMHLCFDDSVLVREFIYSVLERKSC